MQPGTFAARFVESGDQPGAVRVSGVLDITARRRRRHLVPTKGVRAAGWHHRRARGNNASRGAPFHRELANTAELATIPIDEIEIEDLSFAVEAARVPPSRGNKTVAASSPAASPARTAAAGTDRSHLARPRERPGTPGRPTPVHRSISTGCIGSVPRCSASSSPTVMSPIASPSPSQSDFREPDQFGPHASSMSAKVSNRSCGRMRFIRSVTASTGICVSDTGSVSRRHR